MHISGLDILEFIPYIPYTPYIPYIPSPFLYTSIFSLDYSRININSMIYSTKIQEKLDFLQKMTHFSRNLMLIKT